MLPLGVTTPGRGAGAFIASNTASTASAIHPSVRPRCCVSVWSRYCRRVVRIGVAKEIKTDEYRVALTPAGARELVLKGHEVLVETTAGDGSSFPDADYERAGAEIVSVDDAWSRAELLLKVKEPIAAEYPRLREGLVLFTYLHIAADAPLTHALSDSGIAAVAYETV